MKEQLIHVTMDSFVKAARRPTLLWGAVRSLRSGQHGGSAPHRGHRELMVTCPGLPGHALLLPARDTLLGNGLCTPCLGMGSGHPPWAWAVGHLPWEWLWTPSLETDSGHPPRAPLPSPARRCPVTELTTARHCRLSWARGEVIIAQVRPAGLSCHTAHFTVSSDTFVSEFIIYADPQE